MSQELRVKLAEAAGRDGRSLNGEIVRRLEQSLREEAAVAANIPNRGRHMSKRFRLGVAVGLAVLGVAVLGARLAPHAGPALVTPVVDKLHGDPDAIGGGSAEATIGQPESARSAGTDGGAAEKYA